ncbi:MAG: P-type conjugative transfer protein TrbJ [Alphaproteobacteria bacterium 41-28]|nr:MAG: P-type conjugative transfer protein TrbJ [Alphaproteobacteria bacterium 41-28]
MKQKPSPSQGQAFLALKMALVVALTIEFLSIPVQATLPVIDAGNLAQNVMTAMECVNQTQKQVEQYRTQLQQYENMIKNTLQPESYIWDQAQSTIDALVNAVDTLNTYKRELGSIDAYLGKFQDVAYYRRSPCFSSTGCSDTEYAAMAENRRLASQSQKKANDAVLKVLDQQQTTLRKDGMALQHLQSRAQGAKGQMQAIGYANQLASQQIHQLLQIRGLLIAQQNAITMQMQAQNDRTALEVASSEQFLKSNYRASPQRSW